MLLTVLILVYDCGSQSHSILFVCLFRFSCCGNILKKAIKNISGGVNKQHEAIGSILKHQKVSESFRRCQEDSGSIMKAQHHNNNKQTKKNTVALLPHVDSKISTVDKLCQRISALIKVCKKSTVNY